MCTYTGSGTRYGFVVSSLILLVAGVGAGEGPRRCCQRHLDGQSSGEQGKSFSFSALRSRAILGRLGYPKSPDPN